jgi:Spy/CpxP family protein refolding chaperone
MRKVLNNKVLLFIVAILLLANIAMLFYFLWIREPARKNFRGDRQKSPMTEFLQTEIGFNTGQMAAFEKIRQQHRQKMRPLFEDIKTAKVQFYGFLTNPVINDSTLNQSAKLIGEKQKLLDLQTFHNFKEIRGLCTPEQQPKYDSLIVNEISKMWFPSWKGSGRPGKDSPKH